MIYSVYDFDMRAVLIPYSHSPLDTIVRPGQCRVIQASTDEDERYLGTDWQCNHCLPPLTCTVCNPAYKDAVIAPCDACAPAHTWHLNGVCLHCDAKGERHD